jgi:Domain of unknown function (DUF4224)
MTICLTPDEIFEITKKVQPAAQLRALKRMGIRAYRRDDPQGSVCVVRDWLAGTAAAGAQSRPRLKSDREQTAQA